MHAFITQGSRFKVQGSIDMLEINPDTSIGIEEVRQIQHFLSRKPIQSDQNTVIIHQAHLLTIPAQNALLKTLEEPPGNSLIYLITDFPDQLLPTILSRCELSTVNRQLSTGQKDLKKTQTLLEKILKAEVGERLKLLDEQAFTRDTALQFLDQLEFLIHTNISTTPESPPKLGGDIEVVYHLIVQTRKYLKANCNVKLCLDSFGVSLTLPTLLRP